MTEKKTKLNDYYNILGVEKTASEDEIKKAYRFKKCVHNNIQYGE